MEEESGTKVPSFLRSENLFGAQVSIRPVDFCSKAMPLIDPVGQELQGKINNLAKKKKNPQFKTFN